LHERNSQPRPSYRYF